MKTPSCILLLWTFLLTSVTPHSAPFLNLGFENANTNGVRIPFGNVPSIELGRANDLTPGWSPGLVGLTYTRDWSATWPLPFPYILVPEPLAREMDFPLVGSYAFAMKSRTGGGAGLEFTFGQVGDIPYGATEVRFLFRGSVPIVRVAGTPGDQIVHYPGLDVRLGPALSVVRSEDFTTFDHYHQASYISYGISAYAGQTLELSFTGNTPSFSPAYESGGSIYDLYIDDIQFVIVPEPSTGSLIGFSMAFVAYRAVARSRRKATGVNSCELHNG